MSLYYFEQMHFDGSWRPATAPERPRLREEKGKGRSRLAKGEGVGPPIRQIKEITNPAHIGLPLPDLRRLYGTPAPGEPIMVPGFGLV